MNRPLHQVGTRQSMSLNMNEVFGVVRSHVTHHATARRHCALCHVHLFFHSFAQLLVRSELIKDRVAASHLSLLQLLFISPVNGSTMKLSFGSLCFSQNNCHLILDGLSQLFKDTFCYYLLTLVSFQTYMMH